MNEREIATRVAARIGSDASDYLRIQSMIPAGVEKLAREVASDPMRRALLLTNKATSTASVTSSNQDYYADLSTLVTSGVMLDYLEYGTIHHTYATSTFGTSDVNTGNDRITETGHGYPTGLKVRLTTSGGLPGGLSLSTDYFVIRLSEDLYSFASSRANAIAGTAIDLTTTGSGTQTVTPWEQDTVQFTNREFGDLANGVPISYIWAWRTGSRLYTTAISGTFSFSVPFVPTLLTLPAKLENDLIDIVCDLAKGRTEISAASK